MDPQPSPQGAALRAHLKQRTRDIHISLHRHTAFKRLLRGELTIARYRDLTARFYGFYLPLDDAILRALAARGETGTRFSHIRRSEQLARDLVDLGLSARDIAALPTCSRARTIVTPQTLGGVLYVIEGSALGAAQVDPAVRALLDRPDTAGRRFWAQSRLDSNARRAMTHAYMDKLGTEGVSLAAFEAGAAETFQAIADWLSPLDQR